jgi:hypothetical protein
MMKKNCVNYLIVFVLAITAGCKKPYVPPVTTTKTNYLVVEGVINSGQDSTIIKLSRTIPLTSAESSAPELNAAVTVEGEGGISYPLTETGNGNYVVVGLNLNAANKYRLKIITSDKKTYQSDFVPVKNSPSIDSVNYVVKSDGIQINVNTHDPSNTTTYYRWSYNETWEIHSRFNSQYMIIHVPIDTIVLRPLADQVYKCWQSHAANTIVLGSSAKLAQDVISQQQILSIASTSDKLSNRYSILVKQYALTSEAFAYWQQLKKNTEQLGSIFDPQPSEVQGNIHCVDAPSEPVLGYISVGTTSQTRLFVDNYYLPAWVATPLYSDCVRVDTIPLKDRNGLNQVVAFLYPGNETPVGSIQVQGVIIGYTAALPHCVDCTLRGTNKQPGFWTVRQ